MKNIDNRSEIARQFDFIPMWDWKPGMKFVPQEDKYNVGFDIPLKKCSGTHTRLKCSDYSGKIFEVVKVEERRVLCPKGQCTRTYVVFKIEGTNGWFEYEYIGSKKKMQEDKYCDTFQQVDNLRYIGDVSKARKLLIGKTLYILSRMWEGDKVAVDSARKYIPVKILQVGFSNDTFHDTSIVFQSVDNINASINVNLSGINIPFSYRTSSRTFDKLFSIEDPRKTYNRSDTMWDNITKGTIVIGMTESEVILSWGKPNKINKSYPGPNQWIYNSKYLYFKNGVLTAFN